MSSDAHLRPIPPHPMHHGNTTPAGSPTRSTAKPSTTLVDHVAAKNWKEVWKELAPYHTYVVSSDTEEAHLIAFRHLLAKSQHLKSCGSQTSVLDLVLHDNSDRVPTLILEAILAVGVDVESKASIWLRPDYNAAKRTMFVACVRARPDRVFTRPLAGRSYVNDEDLAQIMRQHSHNGDWSTLEDLVRDGKWYAFRNRMRRGVIEEDEFRRKGPSGKTCQQLLLENADNGIQVELAYRYPHLFRELVHVHHHHRYQPSSHQHHHYAPHCPRHEPMQLGISSIPRFDITPPEKEKEPNNTSLTLSNSSSGGSAGSRWRRINSDVSSGDEYDNMDLEKELADMKHWLMNIERKVDGDRAQYASKEKALAGRIADVASQVSGLARSVRNRDLNEEEEKAKGRKDAAVAAEVKAATHEANMALEKAVNDMAAMLGARLSLMEDKIGKLEKAVFGERKESPEVADIITKNGAH